MRILTSVLVGLALVSTASAQYTLIDDMQGYVAGASVHGQGGWSQNINSSAIGDSGASTMVDIGGGNIVANITTLQPDASIGFTSVAIDLGVSLVGRDTLKITFRADGPNDCVTGTNDLGAGWEDLVDNTTLLPPPDGQHDPGGQGIQMWSSQGAMVVLEAADAFRVRDGSSVNPAASGINNYVDNEVYAPDVNTWYDLYMLIDSPNAKTIYAIAPAGGTPRIVTNVNGGDGYFYHRNQAHWNNAVENIRFLMGPSGGVANTVQIDEISYMNGFDPDVPEPATMSLLALGGLAMLRRRR